MSLNLWKSILSPEPILNPEIPNDQESLKAWEWVFEKDSEGQFIRSELARKAIWQHSFELHKRIGGNATGLISLWHIYRKYGNYVARPKRV